jgi:DNA-binding NtrC family response regulator
MEIYLPPLRVRGDDILSLARYMLKKMCKRLNRPPMSFSDEALEVIRGYSWPGNVREMENAVERAVILSEDALVTPELLAIFPASHIPPAHNPLDAANEISAMSLDSYFRHFVLSNQESLSETELAKRLGISRKSLWERRQRLNIPRPSRGKR